MNSHAQKRQWSVLYILPLVTVLMWTTGIRTAAGAVDKQQEPLILGFFPIISTVALYKRFSPLRDYLSETTGRQVLLVTAKDFPTFYDRTARRDYDIVVTAPHYAIKASDSGKYRIRATLTADVQQLIVTRKNSAINNIQQLAGKHVATPPVSALMTMMGKDYLEASGLVDSRMPIYRAFTSHNAANQALLGSEVEAAIASSNTIKKAIKRGEPLKIIGSGQKLPNMATMIAADIPSEMETIIVKSLVEMNKTEKGKAVLKKISFPGYREVGASDYEPARPYTKQLRDLSKE